MVRIQSGVLGLDTIKQVLAALLEIRLHGLLKQSKHRNYDVWGEEVTYAEVKESVPENVSGRETMLLVAQQKTVLSW